MRLSTENQKLPPIIQFAIPQKDTRTCFQTPALLDRHCEVLKELFPCLYKRATKMAFSQFYYLETKQRKNLKSANIWLVDGTSDLLPELSIQFSTYHIESQYFGLPRVFVLLIDNSSKTYKRMMEILNWSTIPNPGKHLTNFLPRRGVELLFFPDSFFQLEKLIANWKLVTKVSRNWT